MSCKNCVEEIYFSFEHIECTYIDTYLITYKQLEFKLTIK